MPDLSLESSLGGAKRGGGEGEYPGEARRRLGELGHGHLRRRAARPGRASAFLVSRPAVRKLSLRAARARFAPGKPASIRGAPSMSAADHTSSARPLPFSPIRAIL